MGPFDNSDKRHGHCKACQVEWHMAPDGRTYYHPYTNFKKKQYVKVVKPKMVLKFAPPKKREKVVVKSSFSFMELARTR